MTWGAVAIAGASLVGGIMSSNATKSAASSASAAQQGTAQLALDQQQKQFDASKTELLRLLTSGQSTQGTMFDAGRADLMKLLNGGRTDALTQFGGGVSEQLKQLAGAQGLMQPYINAGTGALQGQQNLAGLGGAGAQEAAIQQIMQSPQFQNLTQQGENAILQNSSATGGLRGGNVQGALAQFRPSLLSGLIDQQYGRLAGLSGQGQQAAGLSGSLGTQVGSSILGAGTSLGQSLLGAGTSAGQSLLGAGVSGGNNVLNSNVNAGTSLLSGGQSMQNMISQLLQQQGAAQAGGDLATGRANAGLYGGLGGAAGTFVGSGGLQALMNRFGGSSGQVSNVLF